MAGITSVTNYILNGKDIGESTRNWLTRDQLLGIYPSLADGVGRSGLYTFGSYSTGGGMTWGAGYNNLTDPDAISNEVPVAPSYRPRGWIQSAIGGEVNGGIDKDNRLWMWGFNTNNLLPSGAANRSYPVQINAYNESDSRFSFVTIPDIWDLNGTGGSDGPSPVCYAIGTDQKLYSWGKNANYLLGQNDNSETATLLRPKTIGTESLRCKYISGSQYAALAIRDDGRLLTWGRGTGTLLYPLTANVFDRSSPVLFPNSKKWKQVCAGQVHACGIDEDGLLYTWGFNGSYGVLGTNTTGAGSTSPTLISPNKKWRQVSIGYFFTAAIDTEGDLYTWGYGGYGSLGQGNTEHFSSPTLVSSNKKWFRVNCGRITTHMISTSGELYSMGVLINNANYPGATVRPTQVWKQGAGKWFSLSEGGYYLFSGIMINPEEYMNESYVALEGGVSVVNRW